MDRRAWTALLSAGGRPVLKFGSASESVRRLQRALNAARNDRVAVSGVFRASTSATVRRYQRDLGLPRTGVVTAEVWDALQRGRR
jgi:peptidoglycan hydrolase-like protein with peptidoglycan-binding domain